MRKKPYLSFNLRATFDKEGRVRLSSGDPRLKEAGWSLTLNRRTRDEELLRNMLKDHLAGSDAINLGQIEQEDQADLRFVTPANTVGNAITRYGRNTTVGSLGTYLGQTIADDSQPVFYSPVADTHSNYVPLCLISGKPGSGSASLARKMMHGAALQGAYGVSFSWHDEGQLGGMANQIILRDQPEGFLNPFALGETQEERIENALTVTTMLLGGSEMLSPSQHQRLRAAATAMVASEQYPSVEKTIYQLEMDWEKTGRPYSENTLVQNLREIWQLPQAKLVFSTGYADHKPLALTPGITSIVPLGLRLPDPNAPTIQRSNEETLAATIAYLIALSVKNAMIHAPKASPKVFYMDESWILTQRRAGVMLIEEMLRFGRNLQAGIILAAQRPQELLALARHDGARMLFEPDAYADRAAAWELVHGKAAEENIVLTAHGLKRGQFYMKDVYGRTAAVQISGMEPKE